MGVSLYHQNLTQQLRWEDSRWSSQALRVKAVPTQCSHLRRPSVLLVQPVILSALLLILRVELLQVPTYCINVIFFYQLILHRQTKTKLTTVLVLTCFSRSIYIQIIFQFQKLLFYHKASKPLLTSCEFCFVLFLETESHYATQSGLEFIAILAFLMLELKICTTHPSNKKNTL